MISADKMRRLEIKDAAGNWVAASFGQIESGDAIRCTNRTGRSHGRG